MARRIENAQATQPTPEAENSYKIWAQMNRHANRAVSDFSGGLDEFALILAKAFNMCPSDVLLLDNLPTIWI